MSSVTDLNKHDENTATIVAHLRGQGIQSPESHLAGAEYIFCQRETEDPYERTKCYDVIIRFPDDRQIPAYVQSAIVGAMRAETMEDELIFNVHFQALCPFQKRHITRCWHTLHDPGVGLNNCHFKREKTVECDELRFRSKAEVAIYEALKKQPVLFFPNPAAVFGGSDEKREPDFLACLDGKWGILEVMGEAWHTPSNATKDHERGRLFKQFGVRCIEFYDAKRCVDDADGVVRNFLAILRKA